MLKSINAILISLLTFGLVACGGGGGGEDALTAAVKNARAKGVSITVEQAAPLSKTNCAPDENGEMYCWDSDVPNPQRVFEYISWKTVGPTDADLLAAIDALRVVDAAVDGSNLINKQEAHNMIENAIYELQKLRAELLKKGGSSVDGKYQHP